MEQSGMNSENTRRYCTAYSAVRPLAPINRISGSARKKPSRPKSVEITVMKARHTENTRLASSFLSCPNRIEIRTERARCNHVGHSGDDHDHRHHQIDRRQGFLPDVMSDKDAIDNGVHGREAHADHRRQGTLEKQLQYG